MQALPAVQFLRMWDNVVNIMDKAFLHDIWISGLKRDKATHTYV